MARNPREETKDAAQPKSGPEKTTSDKRDVTDSTDALCNCLRSVDALTDEDTLRVLRSVAAYRGIAL